MGRGYGKTPPGVRIPSFPSQSRRGIVLTTQWKPERVTLWDAESGTKQLSVIQHDKFHVDNVSFEHSSNYVITYQLDKNPTLYFWDILTGKKVQAFSGRTGWLRGAVLTPDGKTVISASADKTVRFWDMETGKEIKRFDPKWPQRSVLLSPDGKALYTTWDNGSAGSSGTLWDLESGKSVRETESIDFVGFSPDGTRFLTRQSMDELRAGRPATWFDSRIGKAIPGVK